MACFFENTGSGQRQVVLTFSREQLMYDVENYAYIEGDVMGPDGGHARHVTQDVAQEGNRDRVTRVLDLGVAKLRELLYPYTKSDVRREAYDDRLRERRMYGVVMSVPPMMSETTISLLERAAHEYLVCRAVADWMSIANPAKADTWLSKASEAEMEIRGCMNTRIGRIRRGLHPF